MGKVTNCNKLKKQTKPFSKATKNKISTPISRINKKISKKERHKLKKQKVLEGIKNTKRKFEEEKERIKREKTIITGDLKPLLDSLPSLDDLITIRNKSKANVHPRNMQPKPKNKFEKKKMLISEKTEKFLDRFDHMQKMWSDPEFKKNPRQVLAERIKKNRCENEMKH